MLMTVDFIVTSGLGVYSGTDVLDEVTEQTILFDQKQ
jgi:hypothetical protein